MKFKLNDISKEELYKLNEDDLMFITNPGRMGDEDGSTFIIKNGNSLKAYRVSHWMYNTEKCVIELKDMEKVFPKWIEAWNKSQDKDYDGKYVYVYMGFGNGLCVDKRIYDVFKGYLDLRIAAKAIEENIDEESNKYSLIYNTWKEAAIHAASKLNCVVELDEKNNKL